MANPLVRTTPIRLGMVGMSPGNGHPYSWSAIFNGYDAERMKTECPYPGIIDYLERQPADGLTIPDVRVTHIYCGGEGEFSAAQVANCTYIENVVERPEDLVGTVDAVIIATDIGSEHVDRVRPFVEAGIPVFLDKPMVDNIEDLRSFNGWIAQGKPILSSSSARYLKEFLPYHESTRNLGALGFVSITMSKKWQTYAIHALEAVFPILGPGFISCRCTGTESKSIAHYTHRSGADVVILLRDDLTGSAGLLTIAGTRGGDQIKAMDVFYSFKKQLEAFIDYLRTGERPFPYSETEELMRMVVAGIQSREMGGAEVALADML